MSVHIKLVFDEALIKQGLANAVENNLWFSGQYYDVETGAHYNYYRDYDPNLGRYLQSDPIGLIGGVNIYAYVYNNPFILYDPYGLWAWGDPLPQGVVDFSAGFGDAASFGGTRAIRDYFDVSGGVDVCSSSYAAGELTQAAFGLVNAASAVKSATKAQHLALKKAKSWRANSRTSRMTGKRRAVQARKNLRDQYAKSITRQVSKYSAEGKASSVIDDYHESKNINTSSGCECN